MENLYRVKSTYYLSQAQADFEYSWFVYQRSNNYKSQAERNVTTKSAHAASAEQITQELFTFQEACQLKAILTNLFAGITGVLEIITTIEEVTAPLAPEEFCSLKA